MKIAVLSDVHANFVALQAVSQHIESWRPDVVVVAGDVVNRGPRPAECLRFVLEKQASSGWLTVIGNHEEYVIRHAKPGDSRYGLEFDLRQISYWTYQQLNRDVAALQSMPYTLRLATPDDHAILITHASVRGTRDGVFAGTPDDELRRQIGLPLPSLFCVGHTHLPLVRRLTSATVVNAGSAGLPFDRDPRAGYAQLTWDAGAREWRTHIARVEYDRMQAECDFETSGFLDNGGPLAQLVLLELRMSCSHLYQWAAQFEQLVLAGKLTIEQAVQEYIRITMV